MNLHEIAKNGTHYDIQTFFETLKLNTSSDEYLEAIQTIINTKNNQKYSPLHCSIFAR